MLHIVLLVLKISGILILVLVGLVLLLLLAGLTVPVRYGIRGSYYGTAKGSVKITWLLHIVSAVISYDGETFVRVKLFGIPVYRPDKVKAARIGRETLKSLEPELPEAKETADAAVRPMKKAGKEEGPPENRMEGQKREAEDTKEQEAAPKKQGGMGRKAAGFMRKLRRLCRRVKSSFRRGDTAIKEIKAWINDEENKKMLREIWHHGKALIRHGLPKKVKGKVVFGFDDPYITGRVLSYGAMLYPLYGKQIDVQPVFDRVIFECEGTIKGRIRMAAVCYRLFAAYRCKKFKALIKKWMG